jgi:hypothetical protein
VIFQKVHARRRHRQTGCWNPSIRPLRRAYGILQARFGPEKLPFDALDISMGPHQMMNHAHCTKWAERRGPQWFRKRWECVCIPKCTFTVAKTVSKDLVGAPNLISGKMAQPAPSARWTCRRQ